MIFLADYKKNLKIKVNDQASPLFNNVSDNEGG